MDKGVVRILEGLVAVGFLLFAGFQIYAQHSLEVAAGMDKYYSRKAAEEKALPLTIGDLTEYSDEDYSTSKSENTLDQRTYTDYTQKAGLFAQLEEGQPEELSYTVSTGTPDVIDAYIQKTVPTLGGQEAETFDASSWRAEEGYRAVAKDGHHHYLLKWGTRAIELEFGWEPTEEQLDTAVNELLK